MKDKVLKYNKENLEKLPINSLYWDYKGSDDAVIVKIVHSTFYTTTERLIGKFYKSISPISL